jgi:hypothetical protein
MGHERRIKQAAETSATPPIASIRRQGGMDEKGPKTRAEMICFNQLLGPQ